MLRSLSLAVLALLVAEPSVAGANRRLLDLVRIEKGRFLYDQSSICELQVPGRTTSKFQMRTHAESPSQSVVSRDHFVSLVTQIEQTWALGIAQRASGLAPVEALRALSCTPLEQPIGTPDLELNVAMTVEGLQVEMTDTASAKKSRSVQTWAEVYK